MPLSWVVHQPILCLCICFCICIWFCLCIVLFSSHTLWWRARSTNKPLLLIWAAFFKVEMVFVHLVPVWSEWQDSHNVSKYLGTSLSYSIYVFWILRDEFILQYSYTLYHSSVVHDGGLGMIRGLLCTVLARRLPLRRIVHKSLHIDHQCRLGSFKLHHLSSALA